MVIKEPYRRSCLVREGHLIVDVMGTVCLASSMYVRSYRDGAYGDSYDLRWRDGAHERTVTCLLCIATGLMPRS